MSIIDKGDSNLDQVGGCQNLAIIRPKSPEFWKGFLMKDLRKSVSNAGISRVSSVQ